MIELSAHDIARMTGGRLAEGTDPAITVSHADTDSRQMRPGSLFIAKPGEFADGADFVPQALAAGAALVLAQHELGPVNAGAVPAVLVDDVVLAMGRLAHAILADLPDVRVVGITGSAGKTTTKDLLARILGTQGPTVFPRGSYNGEVGVPLTVFDVSADTDFLVIEMGATKLGHIAYLAEMVKPSVGVELMVGSAHAGEFGGVENIAQAKSELVAALPASGTAVLNADDARVRAMAQKTEAPVLYFSARDSALDSARDSGAVSGDAVYVRDISHNDAGHPMFTLVFPGGEEQRITSGLLGDHHIANIAAAAAAAYALDVPARDIARAIDGAGPGSRWRMERTERLDGITIINDAYNANPESMRAALHTLAELGSPLGGGRKRRTWAVLGEMLELGDEHISAHDELGRRAVKLNIDKLLVIGTGAKAIHTGAVMEGSWSDEAQWVPDLDAAYELLTEQLRPGDIVLFKSSNGAKVRELGDRLALKDGAGTAGQTGSAPERPGETKDEFLDTRGTDGHENGSAR